MADRSPSRRRLRSPFEPISPFGPIGDLLVTVGAIVAGAAATAWMVTP